MTTRCGYRPVCLAAAERVGGVSGKDFICAVVLGLEIMSGLGLAVNKSMLLSGHATTGHLSTFGAALGAAKLLGLDREQMINALGIAYCQVSGNLQTSTEGTMMPRVQQGFAAQTGLLSAIMAESGIDGPHEVFEGKFGYFPVYHPNHYDSSIATRDLGRVFETLQISIKYFPCCLLTHSAITATLQLTAEEEIDPRNVDNIQVRVNQGAYNVVCTPLERKRRPSSNHEALFSLPYTSASALVRGHVALEDFTSETIQDEEVRSLAQKITPIVDEEIEKEYGRTIGAAIVEITLKNGKKASNRVDFVKGNPKNPMNMEDVEKKVRACVPYSAKPLEEKKISVLIDTVKGLETFPDVSRIIDYLK